jgi:hypothetical protein
MNAAVADISPAVQAAIARSALADAFPRLPREDLHHAKVRLQTALLLLRDAQDVLETHTTLSAQCSTARRAAKAALQSVVLLVEGRA